MDKAYMFTGVQRTTNGDTTIPLVEYNTKDAFLAAYHQEMAYAIGNSNFFGLVIKVYDNDNMIDVLVDTWYRKQEPDTTSYMFTGIQHTISNGDVVIPVVEYSTKDAFLAAYHQEMAYAIGNEDFTGLTIKVYDKEHMNDVLFDTWNRESVDN